MEVEIKKLAKNEVEITCEMPLESAEKQGMLNIHRIYAAKILGKIFLGHGF